MVLPVVSMPAFPIGNPRLRYSIVLQCTNSPTDLSSATRMFCAARGSAMTTCITLQTSLGGGGRGTSATTPLPGKTGLRLKLPMFGKMTAARPRKEDIDFPWGRRTRVLSLNREKTRRSHEVHSSSRPHARASMSRRSHEPSGGGMQAKNVGNATPDGNTREQGAPKADS